MRSNLSGSIVLVALIPLLIFGCRRDNDYCDGEPISIINNERLAFQFFGTGNESIFKDDFIMDSLKIFENGNELEIDIDSTYYFEAPMVYIVSRITRGDSIEYNLGDTLNTQILIEFGANKTDTLNISSVPNRFYEPCGGYAYDYVRIEYNSQLLRHYERTDSIIRGALGTLRPFTVYVYE